MEGNTGTNAWTMQIVGRGIAMGLLSIPEKYMHTPVEVVELSDVQAVADLMAEFLRDLTGRWAHDRTDEAAVRTAGAVRL